jgi:HPt (histidine-containing phosphotransfer) domain-containing protein
MQEELVDGNNAGIARQEAAMDESLNQGLAAIAGLDAARGLKHLRGRTDSYVRLLRTFAETRDDDIEAMSDLLKDGNYTELSALMHNIKGVSGFLGATELQHLASEICAAVRAGKEGAEIDRLGTAMMAAQANLSAGILKLIGRSPKGESA